MAKKPPAAKPPKKAKEPKAPKAPKAPKPKGPKAENPRAAKGGNTIVSDDQRRESFLKFRSQVVALQAKADAANKLVKEALKEAKDAGFPKKHFDIAKALASGLKGEKKITGEVQDRLQVARWIGHSLGAQMDLFNEPDRTPSVDRAYDAGKQASMEGAARDGGRHHPTTEVYRAWMSGFDDHQRELHGGFKTATRPDEKENRVAARAAREEDFPDLNEEDDGDDGDDADGGTDDSMEAEFNGED